MKKIKFIDLETEEEEVEFGTCELCFSTGTVNNPVLTFKVVKEDGSEEKLSINGYEWDWGDYNEIDITNLVDFAAFLDPLEFDDSVEFNQGWLWKISRCYNTLYDIQHPYVEEVK
jgi:hypothetical protein